MSRIDKALDCRPNELNARWDELAPQLFDSLRQDVREEAVREAKRAFEDRNDQPRLQQAVRAVAIIECAQKARASWSRVKPHVDRLSEELDMEQVVTSVMSVFPGISNKEELRDWVWGCIRSLLPVDPVRRVDVPIVAVSGRNKSASILCLRLELYKSIIPALFLHPRDLMKLGPEQLDDKLRASMRLAWGQASGDNPQGSCAYRVLDGWSSGRAGRDALHAVSSCGGASASAASLRGMWHLLENKVPDEGVVVLGEVTQGGMLCVDNIETKVQAVMDHNDGLHSTGVRKAGVLRFDTLVIGRRNAQGTSITSLAELTSRWPGRFHLAKCTEDEDVVLLRLGI